jgi:hypothetical protein
VRSNTRSSKLSSAKAPRFYTYDKRNHSAESVSGGLVPGASSDLPSYKETKQRKQIINNNAAYIKNFEKKKREA